MNNCEEIKIGQYMPLISVIIPCYNSESTIERTLDSLAQQTYGSFELILVNDGSTDNSSKVIKKYLKKSNLKYEYIEQENLGVSTARNKGIEKSKGKYITFLDADDLYHKEFLTILVNSLEKSNADTSFCSYTRNIGEFEGKVNDEDYRILEHEKLMENFMYRVGPNGFWTFIYKSSIIKGYDISFTNDLKYGEDLEFTWKYLSHCKTGTFINIPLYLYLDTPKSAINHISWSITDSLKSVENVENYLKKNANDFYHLYKNYMYDRTLIAILIDFSKTGAGKYYYKLLEQNDTSKIQKNMLKHCKDKRIKLLAFLLNFNERLFYHVLNALYKILKF